MAIKALHLIIYSLGGTGDYYQAKEVRQHCLITFMWNLRELISQTLRVEWYSPFYIYIFFLPRHKKKLWVLLCFTQLCFWLTFRIAPIIAVTTSHTEVSSSPVSKPSHCSQHSVLVLPCVDAVFV